jgi:hypothetical protein
MSHVLALPEPDRTAPRKRRIVSCSGAVRQKSESPDDYQTWRKTLDQSQKSVSA